MNFPGRFYTSCVIHTQEETFSCSANGSNPATAVWQCKFSPGSVITTNHQTNINNDQNDLSSMPKMTQAIDRQQNLKRLPLVDEIQLTRTFSGGGEGGVA